MGQMDGQGDGPRGNDPLVAALRKVRLRLGVRRWVGYTATALLIGATAACLWVLLTRLGRLDRLWQWQWALIIIPLLLVAGMSLELLPLGGSAAILFNLVFLAHCVLFIVQGSRDVDAKLVSIACVLFALLTITRYVDLFDSLLLRSLVFLLLGAGVFVVGNFYSRTKRRIEEAGV